jgi:hypothetical protein
MADRKYAKYALPRLALLLVSAVASSACTTGTTPVCSDASDMCGPIFTEAGPLPQDSAPDVPAAADAGIDSPAPVDAPDDTPPPPVDAPQDAPPG